MTVQLPDSQKRHRKLTLPNGTAEVWLRPCGNRVEMHFVLPNGSGTTLWDCCDVDGCLGAAVTSTGKCLGHADAVSRGEYLSSLAGNGQVVLARGVVLTPELLDALLASPHVADSSKKLVRLPISLAGADITAPIDLSGYTFDGFLELNGAIVRQSSRLRFTNCTFDKPLLFRFAFFEGGPPSFSDSKFNDALDISYAHAERVTISFRNCTFSSIFMAEGLAGTLSLDRCQCKSPV